MKSFVAVTFAALLAIAAAGDTDVCHDTFVQACSAVDAGAGPTSCNSLLGGFSQAESDLQSYVNSQLATSYDYLLLATHFNSYQKNRPGFQKLYKDLSDRSWKNSIELIKKITQRGGSANFNVRHEIPSTVSDQKKKLEVDELHSLALALDSEKKLSNDAHHIHRRVSRLDNREHYDPEIAQYLEEEFLEEQAGTVRKLSGYVNDLSSLARVADPSLNVFLFDEYLQKQ